MVNSHFAEKRADPRYSFFADAEVILGDGTSVPTQLAELSASGCYIGTLLPISTGTRFRIRIWDGVGTCELQGKVMYLHSSSGLGIFGMGVMLEEITAELGAATRQAVAQYAEEVRASAFPDGG